MAERLRIIQVINVRWFNATAWYGLYLSKLLREAGHEVIVLALPGTPPYAKAVEWGLQVLPFSNSSNPFAVRRLWRDMDSLLARYRPHVVNCHRGENYFLWCLRRKKDKNFVLVRTRGDQRPPAANLANRWLYAAAADAVIATNSKMARALGKDLAVPEKRLHTILGGVDRDFFKPDEAGGKELRRELGFGQEDFVFGLLGRFDPVKGHAELIRALARVQEPRKGLKEPWQQNLRLLFAGRPANISADTLEKEMSGQGVRGAVLTPGSGKWEHLSIPACISAMDVGVVNSQGSEAIARAALEIMSCRVPLLGSTVGVMPDILCREAMVEPGDVSSLAILLEKAFRYVDFRKQLVQLQGQTISGLSGRDFLQKTLQVYEEALCRLG